MARVCGTYCRNSVIINGSRVYSNNSAYYVTTYGTIACQYSVDLQIKEGSEVYTTNELGLAVSLNESNLTTDESSEIYSGDKSVLSTNYNSGSVMVKVYNEKNGILNINGFVEAIIYQYRITANLMTSAVVNEIKTPPYADARYNTADYVKINVSGKAQLKKLTSTSNKFIALNMSGDATVTCNFRMYNPYLQLNMVSGSLYGNCKIRGTTNNIISGGEIHGNIDK